MSTAIEATGFVMCLIGWLVTGASLANDYWKISSVYGSVLTSYREFQNLWHSCAENSASIAECRDFESMLGLPGYIQGCRGLMIVSLLLGLCSMIVSLGGMKFIKIGSATDQSKAKIAVGGGVLSILAGLCCITAVSWYAFRVVQEFHDPYYGGEKYEFGTGLFLGWGGGSLSFLGGGFLCCACSRVSSGGKKGAYYGNPPQKVYTATAKSDPDAPRAYV
ncbi:claudin 15-like a [Chelmon rostratus]|uniref:claudin 15-like a n=1 Tax=Chelmon rostratus TaxID=109905 RepID=UPI001BEA4924|nr:claudin 15-like a [Chelmon rostratus]